MLIFRDEDGEFMEENDIADKILALLIGGQDIASSATALVVKYLAELPERSMMESTKVYIEAFIR